MPSVATREAIASLLESAPAVDSRTIAMGFTADLDVVLAGSPALSSHMRRWCTESAAAEEAAVWQAILGEQARCALEDRGGELAIEPAAVLARLEEYGVVMTFGGTGVRAAAQAARLGQRTIVSIPAADPRLAALLAGPLIALVPDECSTQLPTHYVIELTGIMTDGAPTDTRESGQRPNRLILRGEETPMPWPPDSFITSIVACRPPARMLLLSGFNRDTSMLELEQTLCHAAGWLRELRRQAPAVWIYLEMAGFPSRAALQRVLRYVGPLADAVGMNQDECAAALDSRRPLASLAPRAQLTSMRETLIRYRLQRLVVHTAWMSSYLGQAPLAGTEAAAAARALALGNTAASFRFATGYDGVRGDLLPAVRDWELAPEGIDCANAARGQADMVVVPAWRIPRGEGTIGLGDCFTGALMSGFDPSRGCAV